MSLRRQIIGRQTDIDSRYISTFVDFPRTSHCLANIHYSFRGASRDFDGVWGLGSGVWGLGSRVSGLGSRVSGGVWGAGVVGWGGGINKEQNMEIIITDWCCFPEIDIYEQTPKHVLTYQTLFLHLCLTCLRVVLYQAILFL